MPDQARVLYTTNSSCSEAATSEAMWLAVALRHDSRVFTDGFYSVGSVADSIQWQVSYFGSSNAEVVLTTKVLAENIASENIVDTLGQCRAKVGTGFGLCMEPQDDDRQLWRVVHRSYRTRRPKTAK